VSTPMDAKVRLTSQGFEADYDSGSQEEGQGLSEEEDDDDGDGDEENPDEEDDEESAEKKAKIRQLTGEIKALEVAVEKKRATYTGGSNPIMKVGHRPRAGQASIHPTKGSDKRRFSSHDGC
jgi:TATA-binding protein-associated factor Taf7